MSVNPFIRRIWHNQNMTMFMEYRSDTMNIGFTCQQCGKPGLVKVAIDEWDRWTRGEFIQDVWPDLSPAQREEITYCIHAKCSDDFYGVES